MVKGDSGLEYLKWMLDREIMWIDEHIKLRDLTQKKIEKLEKESRAPELNDQLQSFQHIQYQEKHKSNKETANVAY